MALWQWSTTPASNATAGAINWAEGQPPSSVNDSARQMMADVATWFAGPEWINYGLTPTYVSGTQFTLAGNQTSIFTVGRRVKAFVTAGTVYGTITASAFTSLTTVTVKLDSGNLDSGLSEVDVGILNPAAPSLSTLQSLTINSATGLTMAELTSPNVSPIRYGDGTGWTLYFQTLASSAFASLSDKGNLVVIGNITAGGNITANSDERLKTDWGALADDFVDRLAAVRSGTYTRVDTEQRHVGVGAQSLQALLPEAVVESDEGVLSVAYGQAALAACVELAKEVVRLRAMLESAK